MEVVIAVPEELAALAAGAIESLLATTPAAVLGLATGSSPLGIYDELARRHADGRVSFARARAFMLDEYVGLAADHPERYRNVIETEIASRVDFAPGAVQGPDGLAQDIVAACVRYEAAIVDAGGVDLQILGIGSDGHVGFNEPGSSLASRTRIKTLTEQTRVDNGRFFGGDVDQVPRHCLTQGLAVHRSRRSGARPPLSAVREEPQDPLDLSRDRLAARSDVPPGIDRRSRRIERLPHRLGEQDVEVRRDVDLGHSGPHRALQLVV